MQMAVRYIPCGVFYFMVDPAGQTGSIATLRKLAPPNQTYNQAQNPGARAAQQQVDSGHSDYRAEVVRRMDISARFAVSRPWWKPVARFYKDHEAGRCVAWVVLIVHDT